MTPRPLTDDRLAAALRGHIPAANAALRQRILSEISTSAQERRLPSILGRLTDADPIARRRSMLLLALVGLALSVFVAGIAGGLLRDRRPPDLSLVPPTPEASLVTPTPDASLVTPTPDASLVTPTPDASLVTPTPDASRVPPSGIVSTGKVFGGWPTTSRNPAGVYSFGSGCAGTYCIIGWMHNGYGSGDVAIKINTFADAPGTRAGATPVGVAGRDGWYRQLDDGTEQWFVDFDGNFVLIQLVARSNASAADLAEAHAIVESLRTDPQDASVGFTLYFTLTSDDWDSG
jgi:hypothetical protein